MDPVVFTALHTSDVTWETRAIPRFPEEAREMELGPVQCRIRLYVDATGALDHSTFLACPHVFHDPVLSAVQSSRWVPHQVDGAPVPFQFVVIYAFVDDKEGSADPALLNTLPDSSVYAQWCRPTHAPLEAFRSLPVEGLAFDTIPALHVLGEDETCHVTLYVDPRGRPVHVAVSGAPEDWGWRIATMWCQARVHKPGDAVSFVRPCEP